jgi:hypothetical protein
MAPIVAPRVRRGLVAVLFVPEGASGTAPQGRDDRAVFADSERRKIGSIAEVERHVLNFGGVG